MYVRILVMEILLECRYMFRGYCRSGGTGIEDTIGVEVWVLKIL